MKRLALFFATGFYSGYAPFAPGTFGSVVGVIVYFAARSLPVPAQAVFIIVYAVFSYYATCIAIKHFQKSDPSQVVCDEVLGMWIALIFFDLTIIFALIAFVIFRILDIFKPFPIRQIEKRTPGAYGVILDDVAAGFITKGVMWLLLPGVLY